MVLRALAASVMATLLLAAAPATASAAPALATDSYRVKIHCEGAGFIDGYGSTMTNANRQALLLCQFYRTSGRACTGTAASGSAGSFRVQIHCTTPGRFIEGYGSTMTDAADEARELAILSTSIGRHCTGSTASGSADSYMVRLHCTTPGRFYEGFGTTMTGAAQNARLAVIVG